MKLLLNLDGGGMKGLITSNLLQYLEQKTGKQCYQIFDLIAGTSIGGILSCCLTKGLTATETLPFFINDGPKIFSKNFFNKLGLFGAKYSSYNIEEALINHLQYTVVGDAKTKLLVSSYDINDNGNPFFFKSYDDASKIYYMWEAGRGSSAAPTYFPLFKLDNMILSDGGIVANNISMCALADALKLWPGEDVRILSIGTGVLNKESDATSLINAGLIKEGINMIESLYNGTNQEVDYQCKAIIGDKYYRIDPNLIEPVEMDDASEDGLNKLKSAAAAAVEEFSPLIDKFVAECV